MKFYHGYRDIIGVLTLGLLLSAIFSLAISPALSQDTSTPTPHIVNDTKGVPMVIVPAGTFQMGLSEDQAEAAVNVCINLVSANQDADRAKATCNYFIRLSTPAHAVNVAQFAIDVNETTNSQYKSCVDAGACTEIPLCPFSQESTVTTADQANHSIQCISAHAAETYCEWREMRLPTEAEWEYAARGPNNNLYPWGNEFDQTVLDALAQNNPYNVPVGSNLQDVSWSGVHDMAGSLEEWVSITSDSLPYPNRDKIIIQRGSFYNGNQYTFQATWRGSSLPLPGKSLFSSIPVQTIRCATSENLPTASPVGQSSISSGSVLDMSNILELQGLVTLNYPSDWKVLQRNPNAMIVGPQQATNLTDADMTMEVDPIGDVSDLASFAQQIIDQQKQSFGAEVVEAPTFVALDGAQGLRTQLKGTVQGVSYHLFYVIATHPSTGKAILVGFTAKEDAWKSFEQNAEIMLSTLKWVR